tara:strand:+ start:2599 stop:3621 length:1023 start_codon:yes stop_codon:yes gene_type:complete
MNTLVTGAAGFIGFHLCKKLLKEGYSIIGFDNFNDYYDPHLKESRLKELEKISSKTGSKLIFIRGDLKEILTVKDVFETYKPEKVINLAAQAGVRYSLENPSEYIESNIIGFFNIIENCRKFKIKHLIYASSSSVYGGNTKMPFEESQNVDHPVSLYAATKKSNELIAHTYSHLYNLPSTGLRFFTVYGPWGRPDMALFLFTKSIIEEKPIEVFNNGNMIRDFTYIDDIVESIFRLLEKIPYSNKMFDSINPNPARSWAPYRVFNIGNSNPTYLLDYISAIENELGTKAIKKYLPLQQGDVPITSSDCTELESYIGFKPNTSIKDGIKEFIKWYKNFYAI